MVSKTDIQKEHTKLKEKIKFHNEKYHSEDNPEISDQEFDLLFKELKDLENKYTFLDTTDSPTRMVGGKKLSVLKPSCAPTSSDMILSFPKYFLIISEKLYLLLLK